MNAFLHTQSSKCTRLLFSQTFCMPVTHGPCTAGMSRNSTGFTLIACAGFSISNGDTGSLTLRSLNHAELLSIHTYLCKAQLHWTGYVLRMDDEHLPIHLLFGELIEGKRSTRGQKKHFKDILKASLKDFSIDPDMWENLALDRASWQNAMHCGAASYKSQWTSHVIMKKAVHKAKVVCAPPDSVKHVCPHCGRLLHACIGLVSHLQSHQTWMTMWCHSLLPLGWLNTLMAITSVKDIPSAFTTQWHNICHGYGQLTSQLLTGKSLPPNKIWFYSWYNFKATLI